MELKAGKTMANLMAAFAGESQARNKYTYYAAKARQDGYEQIAEIFEETANNEKEHAEIWWKLISQGAGETKDNLDDAAKGENYEWTTMYKTFAEEARNEGFDSIAALFELVAGIEQSHEERFRRLSENISSNKVFEKEEEELWVCRNCGHIHKGKSAPSVCPVCSHKQSYFEVRAENY